MNNQRVFQLPSGISVLADSDKKTLTIQLDGGASMELTYSDQQSGQRKCGTCDLCCRLVPVEEIAKPAFQRCQFARYHAGGCCRIYAKPTMPRSCSHWSCRWLIDPTVRMPRPDRAHFVIDVMPDTITTIEDDGTERTRFVVQIWQDPAHPNAHENAALRAWIATNAAATGMAALVRTGHDEDVLLAPPSLVDAGVWVVRKTLPRTRTGLWETGSC